MAKSATIILTTAGTDTGPFNLLSNVDGYVTPFETGIASIKFRGVDINSTLFTGNGELIIGSNKYNIIYVDSCFNTA